MAKEEPPHEVLGVQQNSTRTEIKAAYYRQAKQWHPDKNSTAFAAERFKIVQGAMRTMLAQHQVCFASVRSASVTCLIHYGPKPCALVDCSDSRCVQRGLCPHVR